MLMYIVCGYMPMQEVYSHALTRMECAFESCLVGIGPLHIRVLRMLSGLVTYAPLSIYHIALHVVWPCCIRHAHNPPVLLSRTSLKFVHLIAQIMLLLI